MKFPHAFYSLYRAALRVGGGRKEREREIKYRRENKREKEVENWKRNSILQIVITAKVIPWNVLGCNNPGFTGL